MTKLVAKPVVSGMLLGAEIPIAESVMDRIGRVVVELLTDESGQDLIEYALLSAFVALLCVVGATSLGTALNNWYASVGGAVDAHAASAS